MIDVQNDSNQHGVGHIGPSKTHQNTFRPVPIVCWVPDAPKKNSIILYIRLYPFQKGSTIHLTLWVSTCIYWVASLNQRSSPVPLVTRSVMGPPTGRCPDELGRERLEPASWSTNFCLLDDQYWTYTKTHLQAKKHHGPDSS